MYQLVFRRYAPFSEFGGGFEGDHRINASTSLNDTARTIGIIGFDRTSIGSITGSSSGTRYIGAGKKIENFIGTKTSSVSTSVNSKIISLNQIAFTASTAGANPMTPPGSPDIDTYVDFKAEWLVQPNSDIATHIRFSGKIRGDNFPNAEVFVLDANSGGVLLFNGVTTGGKNTGPMTRLAGAHVNQILGNFSNVVSISNEKFDKSYSCAPTTMV